MSAAVSSGRLRDRCSTPELRLLRSGGEAQSLRSAREAQERRPVLRVIEDEGPARVLVVGPSAERRAALLDELTRTLPPSTRFEQAGAVSEVLEHASASRMVVLAGDLAEAPTDALARMLAHRHPELPVLSVDEASASSLAS
jgi:molybdopterin-guanine dinucleotide biosynthesis protein A